MVRTTTHETYCPQCDDRREIKKTVPWQADLCTSCGSNVGDEDATRREATRRVEKRRPAADSNFQWLHDARAETGTEN